MQEQQAEPRKVTKGQFATIVGVSPGRVSQWISEKKIHGDALIGEGRSAMINLDVAQDQLGRTLDFDQRQAQAIAKPAAPAASLTPDQLRIHAVKAETAEIELRKLQRQEQEQQGILINAAQARQAWGREIADLIAAIEQWLPEAALRLERDLGVEHKAATSALRAAFRELRTKRADLARSAAFALPDLIGERTDENPAVQSAADGEGGDGGGD
jgi:plasmid maintenance system antidote protein VapI